MAHLVLLFYLAALAIGFVSLGISIRLAVTWRHRALRHFIVFFISLLGALFSLCIKTYANLAAAADAAFFAELYLAAMSLGNLLYICISPFFFHSLLGLAVTKPKMIFFICSDVLLGSAALLYFMFRWEALLFGVLIPSLFLMLGYGIVLILFNLKNIGDPGLRRVLKFFCFVSALFLPLLYLDAMFERIALLAPFAPFGLLTLPAYFITVNVLCIFFTRSRFSRPAFQDGGGITEFFTDKYGISEREKEIISLMMEGLGNAALGERLFISPKTVENHIYSIYQKTGVKNRVQLANLIRTNRAN